MKWFEKAETAILNACAAALGIEADSKAFNQWFRVAYPEGVTTPQPGSERKVCYLALSEMTDPAMHYTQWRYGENQNGAFGAIQDKTIPLQCLLTFYGTDADEDAELLWSRLMVDTGHGSPRDILRAANLVLVDYPDRPVSMPELEGSLWRRRCDVRMRLNMLVTDFIPASPIEHPPEIETKR